MHTIFHVANVSHAEEIAQLVNRAYRPGNNARGWTHEAALIAGDRINLAGVVELFDAHSVMLLASCADKIVACAHLKNAGDDTYIGMLACEPSLQGLGLGKQMLVQAEQYAVQHFKPRLLKMKILSARPELLAFYQRRGYVLSGEIEDFLREMNAGSAMVSGLKILGLEKIA